MTRIFSLAWRWLLVLSLVGGLSGGWVPAGAAAAPQTDITPEDAAALTSHLQILAQGWNSESWQAANAILSKEQYTVQDWTNFFTGYFEDSPYTDPLWDYLNYPSFWGTSETTQWKLQTALTEVFRAKIAEITAAHGANLSQALAADASLRQTLGNCHRWMMNITQNGNLYDSQLRELLDFYIQHVEAAPQLWAKRRIDTAAQPVIAPLAAQVHAVLRELARADETGKQRVETALGLAGGFRDLWRAFTLLLYDNSRLGDMELAFLQNYFSALPPELRLTRGISVMDYLGNVEPYRVSLWLPGVNIFGISIGQHQENGFPSDVPPLPCDVFGIVVAHETNHSVNAEYIDRQPELKARHDALINNAGRDPLNYLRSMSEEGFFAQNPQEFFAAIANQYFCSSEHTFRLGLERMRQGRPHPLDQALFFADVYSLNGSQTYLYTSDTLGRITRRSAPLYRDAWGLPTGIGLPGGAVYVWRKDGAVGQAGPLPPVLEVSPSSGLEVRLPPDQEQSAALTVHNTGGLNAALHFDYEDRGVADFNGGALRVNNHSSLNCTNQITIEAWIHPRTWEDGYFNNGRVLQKGYADSQYRLLVENGNFVFDLEWVGRLSILDWKPPLNTWTHVAGTYDGVSMRIYINGEKRAEKPATGKLRVTSDNLYIGNKDDRLVDRFMGEMDEVRLWSVARKQAEIQRDAHRRIPQGTPGLVGYWNFDPQPEASPVLDRSGKNNHALPVGDVTVRYGLEEIQLRGDRWQDLLPPGGETSRDFVFSSVGLPLGAYERTLTIKSNDPQRPVFEVPIRLVVTEEQPLEEHPVYLPVIRR